MPRNRHRFALLHQFKQPGKLGLGFVNVHLHKTSLVPFTYSSKRHVPIAPRRSAKMAPTMLKLHLGAFDQIFPGWINTDITPHLAIARIPGLARVMAAAGLLTPHRLQQHRDGTFRQLRKLDVTRPFPFRTASVDAILISHMLSNLTRASAARCLAECSRVLAPGRVLRIATLDLDAVVAAYSPSAPGVFLNLLFDLDTSPRAKNRHWWHYNEISLTAALRQAGFREVTRRAFREGLCPDVQTVDTRPGSLFLEAVK